MEITVSELAAHVGGQLASGADGSAKISGVATLAEAVPGEVTFFGNPKYLSKLRGSKATAALVPLAFAEEVPALCIRCENPTLAFSKAIEKFAPPPVFFPPGIHPTAVIANDVQLGANVSIQPYAVIGEGASIGAGTIIGAHAYVGRASQIGCDCHIHPRATVGDRCKVGNRVILHSGAVLGSAALPGLSLGNGTHGVIGRVSSSYSVGPLTLAATGHMGRIAVDGSASGIVGSTDTLLVSAFAASARYTLPHEAGALTFGFSQPLRVESGTATIQVPTGYDYSAFSVTSISNTTSLSPSGREMDVEIGYAKSFPGYGSLQMNMLDRLAPGHNASAASDKAVLLRWSGRF